MPENTAYKSVAQAQEQTLKEDLALRVAEAINSAGALYMALVTSSEIVESSGVDEQKLKHYLINANAQTDSVLKNAWMRKYEKLKLELETQKELIRKSIDPTNYKVFLEDFFKLWLEAKGQIKNRWSRENLKEDIEKLFTAASYGFHDNARDAVALFYEFMDSLEKCGILNFQDELVDQDATIWSRKHAK